MPTYEYGCEACGHEFEREQRITEDPIKKCPSCGKSKARRLITQGNFILKGGGWYSDLYSGPSNKKSNGKSESSESSSSSTDSSSTTDGSPDSTSSSSSSGEGSSPTKKADKPKKAPSKKSP